MRLINTTKNCIIDTALELAGYDKTPFTIGYITKIRSNNNMKNIVHNLKSKPIVYILISNNQLTVENIKKIESEGYTVTYIFLLSYVNNSSVFYYICIHNYFLGDFNFQNTCEIVTELYMVDGIPFDYTIHVLECIRQQAPAAIYHLYYNPPDFTNDF